MILTKYLLNFRVRLTEQSGTVGSITLMFYCMYKKPVGQGVMVLNQKQIFFYEKGGKYASIEVKTTETMNCRCRLLF